MGKVPQTTKKKVPLKIWDNWSAGIGHTIDDGRTPGMYYAAGILGLRGELRPAPFFNQVTTGIYEPVSVFRYINTTLTYAHATNVVLPASGSNVSALTGALSSKDNAAVLTYSFNMSAGTNTAILVTVHNASAADPTGVTYAGDALTKIASSVGNPRTSLWLRVNPSTGANNVVVTFAGACDQISSVIGLSGVHQTSANGAGTASNGTASNGFTALVNTDGASGCMMIESASVDDTATSSVTTNLVRQAQMLNDTQGAGLRGYASYRKASLATQPGESHFQYFFEAVANTDDQHTFLYTLRGIRLAGANTVVLDKIDLSNGDFATFEANANRLAVVPLLPGQPAKYQGFWWLPSSNDNRSRQLSVVGTGDGSTDTIVGVASPFVAGADHLFVANNRMAGIVKQGISGIPGLGGVGSQDGGVRLLPIDGNPATAASWGQDFPAGDVTDRAAGLTQIDGMTFVLMPDGLYSFNKAGRSGLVLPELGEWVNSYSKNIEMKTWLGGLVIPHPIGLIWYVPGEKPLSIGPTAKAEQRSTPPSGVTELHGGIYHSAAPVGDLLYVVMQPEIDTTTALVMCGYGEPGEMTWQGLGTVTMLDKQLMMGCHVARTSAVLAADVFTPTFWVQNSADLQYMILDDSGSPFRSRADTHKVAQSGDAFMSEVVFPTPVDLEELVVYTSDMLAADEWQFSMVVGHDALDEQVGVARGNARISFPLKRKRVERLTLHVAWSTSNTDSRVPPTLNRIELFGRPS